MKNHECWTICKQTATFEQSKCDEHLSNHAGKKTNRFSMNLFLFNQSRWLCSRSLHYTNMSLLVDGLCCVGKFVIEIDRRTCNLPAVASVANHSDLSKLRFGELTMLKTEINWVPTNLAGKLRCFRMEFWIHPKYICTTWNTNMCWTVRLEMDVTIWNFRLLTDTWRQSNVKRVYRNASKSWTFH